MSCSIVTTLSVDNPSSSTVFDLYPDLDKIYVTLDTSLDLADKALASSHNIYSEKHDTQEEDCGQDLVVWADAVCINQDDPCEKSCQVALMGDIYRLAKRVVVDFGEENETAAPALWLIAVRWRKLVWKGVFVASLPDTPGERRPRLKLVSPQKIAADFGLPEDGIRIEEKAKSSAVELPDRKNPLWSFVLQFFERPWFRRLWVIQKFLLAHELLCKCGKREVK